MSSRSGTTVHGQMAYAILPLRTAKFIRDYAAEKGWSSPELVKLVLADFVLKQRRKRARLEKLDPEVDSP
ncbi:MAG: hypothetical protein IH974_01105 [Myxococcales bacterium]|nr:hypothetical protein [Myxococcales bacterium]